MYVVREKYVDWLGNEREENFRFNISKTDLVKMQFSKDGGFATYLKRIMDSQSQAELMEVFETILELSYGVVSDDGRGFKKNKEVLEDFKSTAAYDQIYLRLCKDSKFAADFVNNVFPSEILEKVREDNENIPELLKKED